MKVAVDLDGFLTKYDEGHSKEDFKMRIPNSFMIDYIRRLKENGLTIVIYTARYPEDRDVTEEWLKKFQVPYDELVMGKYIADIYLKCDRTKDIIEMERWLIEQEDWEE